MADDKSALNGDGRGAPSQETTLAVQFSGVELIGNSLYSDQRLTRLIASDMAKPLTFTDVQALAARIERYYRKNGYDLARVIVPEQAFREGKALELIILEGRLGTIEIRGNTRYPDRYIIDTLETSGLERERAFSLGDVERGLALINRRSGIEVSSTLRPGEVQGATDLVVDVDEQPRITGALEANNYGSENSGEYRLVPALSLLNATGHGDQLDILGMKSLGDGDAYFGYLGYETPINAGGTKAHVYGFSGNVAIGQDFRVLEIEGDSEGWGVGLSHDVVVSSRSIVNVGAWLEGQDLEQSMLGITTSKDRVRKVRLGISIDSTDLQGRTLLSLDVHQGLGDRLGGMDDNALLSSRSYARADNDFTKLTFDLARLQRLNDRWLVVPRLYGQYAFDSLVAGEQWAVGGFHSVLGHPASAFSGDSGYTASLEGRYSLLGEDHYQLIVRADHGRVFVRQPYLGQADDRDISGAGLGLRAQPWESLELRVDYGVPIGSETGDDAYWYGQASYRF
ncbi:ShlB/FhaC/HecB family hemolysin secretion/activation protein [Modicisalibacter xianhensis]|uniref:ShlB/FhaC/HecB family hemolysin secretion/activation protein n=1 Tax=Modicisalibacter xianhensis TaxID=442341 RepID=UPI001FBA42D5|nr:ShlB/FhaC/HecB family hemolysin secretion/activation protein [Halomonas xianhensis]